MFFRNLFLYRIPEGVLENSETFTSDIDTQRLREIGPLELSTTGFVSPFGRDAEALTHTIGAATIFAHAETVKVLPAAVVEEFLAERIATIVEREGRRVGGKERRRLKEDVVSELLPRAFPRTRRTLAYVDHASGWLVVDTSSRKTAEAIVSAIREALGRFPAMPMAPEESPRSLMTDWVVNGKLPAKLTFGEDCVLRDPAEAGAIVRCRRQDLESDEVREHLKSGKQVFELGVTGDERISFVLGEDLCIRRLRFLDNVLDQLGDADDARSEFDSAFALMSLELAPLLIWLDSTFGLPRSEQRLKLDGGDAPKHMRDAHRAEAPAN